MSFHDPKHAAVSDRHTGLTLLKYSGGGIYQDYTLNSVIDVLIDVK